MPCGRTCGKAWNQKELEVSFSKGEGNAHLIKGHRLIPPA